MISATMIAHKQIKPEKMIILLTEPLKIFRHGKFPSSDIAINILGELANDSIAAPYEDKIIATIVRYLVGHVTSTATTYSFVYKVPLSIALP